MPLVGLGTRQLRGTRGCAAMRYALQAGYRHLDTPPCTRTRRTSVARCGQRVPRDEVFVTTKLPPGREGRERRTLATSLKNLGTGYVDLWLVHWPPNRGSSVDVWRALIAA
jgi:diketogulonate reductase-like aldo/keto reductase